MNSYTEFEVTCSLFNQESLQQQSHKKVCFNLYEIYVPFITGWNGRITFLRSMELPVCLRRELARVPAADSLHNHNEEFTRILTNMEIPQGTQTEVLQKIAMTEASQGFSSGTMGVVICAITCQEYDLEDDDIGEAERESMEDGFGTIPATKSSIDELERMVFDGDLGSCIDCMVCMEEIEAGVEAIRMPCLHVYHANCIVQWLQISHFCPLCRYRMPCDM